MTGLWEALPASPCSAISDDSTTRMSRQSTVGPRPPQLIAAKTRSPSTPLSPNIGSLSIQPQNTPPVAKRARIDNKSPGASIEFAEATSNTDSHPHLISKLNDPVMDDRRRQLMERLSAIGKKKAILSGSTASPSASNASPSAAEDEVTFVQEKRTVSVPQTQPRRKSSRAAKPESNPSVIDVDDDYPVLPVSTNPSRRRASSSKLPDPDLLVKRTSSRVRRPRVQRSPSSNDIPDPSRPMPPTMTKCKRFQFCKKLVTTLLRNPDAKPFSAPVVDLWLEQSVPRYFEVISHPMDLGTIKKNLYTCFFLKTVKGEALPYRFDVDKFANEVRLVFRNAMVYNRVGDPLHSTARALMDQFDKTFEERLPLLPMVEKGSPKSKKKVTPSQPRKSKSDGSRRRGRPQSSKSASVDGEGPRKKSRQSKLPNNPPARQDYFESEYEALSVSELKERLLHLRNCREPVLARTPVPRTAGYLTRAALLYDVDMSWHQKKKCSEYIHKVPSSKMEALIDMIKSSTTVDSGEEELEFDMDNVDNKTLRNIEAFLETFLPGFKTARSSSLGREFTSITELDEAIREVRDLITKSSKEKKVSEKEDERVVEKPKSFFEVGNAQDSSTSDSSSGSGSEGSESSDDESASDSD